MRLNTWIQKKRAATYTRNLRAASRLALKDAGIEDTSILEADRFGVLIGSGIGGMLTSRRKAASSTKEGSPRFSIYDSPLIANIASSVVAIEVGARGPNYGIVSACASGTHSIGEAFHMLRDGESDIMLAGDRPPLPNLDTPFLFNEGHEHKLQ